jgi:hypothetical protein
VDQSQGLTSHLLSPSLVKSDLRQFGPSDVLLEPVREQMGVDRRAVGTRGDETRISEQVELVAAHVHASFQPAA